MTIRALLYNAAGHDEEIVVADAATRSLGKDQLLWIDGPVDELRAQKQLPKDIKTALSEELGASSLEILGPVYRFTVPLLPERANGRSRLLGFVVGKTWLVTLSDSRPDFMNRFIETDRGETLNGRMTPSALAVSLVSELLDSYRMELARINKAIDKLDDEIMTAREKKAPLQTLAGLRRQVSALRIALDATGDTVHAFTRPDFFAHIDPADHIYFDGLARSHERLTDSMSRARETIISSFDLYSTRVAQETNQLVRALTIVTVVTGVIGAAAGIFGMNFDTPFAHSGVTGFVDVTVAMFVLTAGIIAMAIWRKWF